MSLFAVAGVTGHTGAATANALLARGQNVRVIVRNPEKAAAWTGRGAEVAIADLADADAMHAALTGVDGAFLLNPPRYDSADPLGDAARTGASLAQAAGKADLSRLVVLSSMGAQHADGTGIIRTIHLVETAFAAAGTPASFLRAPYFLENLAPVLPLAAQQGVLPTLIRPDQVLDMIPVRDIGTAAADILTGAVAAAPVLELHGATPLSMNGVAATLADCLGRPVQALEVPRAGWADAVAQWGLSPAVQALFVGMHAGIDDGTVAWEGRAVIRGRTRLADWVRDML